MFENIFGSQAKVPPIGGLHSEAELRHFVLSVPLAPPYPDGTKTIRFGMGCFWGVERLFWKPDGVYLTAAGYAGGTFVNPGYELVCSGKSGHAEVVQVVYRPNSISLEELLKVFWENHDPTQQMRQGNDVGPQYRSVIYCDDEEDRTVCLESKESYQKKLTEAGFGQVTTEILVEKTFYLAEANHQQYLAKNPGGYCNHGFCQVEY